MPSPYFEAPVTNSERLDPADLIGHALGHGADAILLDVGSLPPEFFDLSTGVAGDLVQRVVNYGLRMAIVVPDAATHSTPFQEFAREANRSRSFAFFSTRAEATDWLRSPQS